MSTTRPAGPLRVAAHQALQEVAALDLSRSLWLASTHAREGWVRTALARVAIDRAAFHGVYWLLAPDRESDWPAALLELPDPRRHRKDKGLAVAVYPRRGPVSGGGSGWGVRWWPAESTDWSRRSGASA